MGADLIGYSVVVPKDTYKSILKKQLATIKQIIGGDKGIKEIADGKAGPWAEEAIERILKAKGCGYDQDYEGEPEVALEHVVSDLELAADFDISDYHRDMTETLGCKVNGKEIIVFFAGELSWGDEPTGDGYNMLKALVRTGAMDKFYEDIPWDIRKGLTKPGKKGKGKR